MSLGKRDTIWATIFIRWQSFITAGQILGTLKYPKYFQKMILYSYFILTAIAKLALLHLSFILFMN